MATPMSWYGDESYDADAGKTGFVLAFVQPYGRLDDLRGVLLDLVLRPGGHLHFYEEDPERRLELTATVLTLPAEIIVVTRSSTDAIARTRAVCLRAAARELHGRADELVLESRGDRPDTVDARLLRRLHPAAHRIPVRFLGKDADPLLWAADIVAGAALQGFIRGVEDFLDVLRGVRRVDG